MPDEIREDHIKAHFELWSWIIRNPGQFKHSAPMFSRGGAFGQGVEFDWCFSCKEGLRQRAMGNVVHRCDACFIDWGSDIDRFPCEEDPNSPYAKWRKYYNVRPLLAQLFALQIINLPILPDPGYDDEGIELYDDEDQYDDYRRER